MGPGRVGRRGRAGWCQDGRGSTQGDDVAPAARPEARPRARSQAGFTLAETIVALLLSSLVVLALAAGMFTLLRTTDLTSRSQRMQAALTTAAESVKAEAYVDCATTTSYAVADPEGPATASITAVRHWDATPTGAELGRFGPTCPPDQGAQRITVQVELDGRTVSAEIVKRKSSTP